MRRVRIAFRAAVVVLALILASRSRSTTSALLGEPGGPAAVGILPAVITEAGPQYWGGRCGGTLVLETPNWAAGDLPVAVGAMHRATSAFAGKWVIRESPYPTQAASGTIVIRMQTSPFGGLVLGETTNDAIPNAGRAEIQSSVVELSPVIAGQASLLTEVIMHELAHAVGAAHATLPGAVTYFEVNGDRTAYESWEISTLQRLTDTADCTSPPRSAPSDPGAAATD